MTIYCFLYRRYKLLLCKLIIELHVIWNTYGFGSGILLSGGAFGTFADFPFFPALLVVNTREINGGTLANTSTDIMSMQALYQRTGESYIAPFTGPLFHI